MPDATRQDFTVFRGEDRPIIITMNAVGSIAIWTSSLFVRDRSDAYVLTRGQVIAAYGAGVPRITLVGTIIDPGSATTVGSFGYTLTDSLSLLLLKGSYDYTAKRTNAGASRVFTYGILNVLNDVENPVP